MFTHLIMWRLVLLVYFNFWTNIFDQTTYNASRLLTDLILSTVFWFLVACLRFTFFARRNLRFVEKTDGWPVLLVSWVLLTKQITQLLVKTSRPAMMDGGVYRRVRDKGSEREREREQRPAWLALTPRPSSHFSALFVPWRTFPEVKRLHIFIFRLFWVGNQTTMRAQYTLHASCSPHQTNNHRLKFLSIMTYFGMVIWTQKTEFCTFKIFHSFNSFWNITFSHLS